jgi:hypothetical protein
MEALPALRNNRAALCLKAPGHDDAEPIVQM